MLFQRNLYVEIIVRLGENHNLFIVDPELYVILSYAKKKKTETDCVRKTTLTNCEIEIETQFS